VEARIRSDAFLLGAFIPSTLRSSRGLFPPRRYKNQQRFLGAVLYGRRPFSARPSQLGFMSD
jgi:hypothetical protein